LGLDGTETGQTGEGLAQDETEIGQTGLELGQDGTVTALQGQTDMTGTYNSFTKKSISQYEAELREDDPDRSEEGGTELSRFVPGTR
jgi:hypothetical protein